MKVNVKCISCNEEILIEVEEEKYNSWKNGDGFIEDIMPELPAEDRELLISGTCDNCWKEMFILYQEDQEDGEELY